MVVEVLHFFEMYYIFQTELPAEMSNMKLMEPEQKQPCDEKFDSII